MWAGVSIPTEFEELAELYDQTFERVFRYACLITGDVRVAEDVAVDVYVSAWRDADRPSADAPPLAWLLQLTRDRAMAQAAPQGGERRSASAPLGSARADPMWAALLQLTGDQQQVLALRFLDSLSPAEIAVLLGRSVASVRALQYRALLRLRDLFVPTESG